MREFMQVSAFVPDEGLPRGDGSDRQFEAGDEDAAVAYFRRLRESGKYEYITLEWLSATGEDAKA